MEKPSKLRHRVLALLPKAAAPVINFQISPPISPRTAGKGSVLPIVSLVPKEARKRSKNGRFDMKEPGSPQVSCTGQVKSNKNNIHRSSKHVSLAPQATVPTVSDPDAKLVASLKFNLLRGRKSGDKSGSPKGEPVADGRVPSLGQAKRFPNARGVLSDFDWKVHEETRKR